MAVSMNMSMPRSDFMISDAALPKRIEELELQEQTNAFANILDGIGTQQVRPAEETPELQAEMLIEAVAQGSISLDELNADMLPENVFKRVVELIKAGAENPEDDIADMQSVASELAAMFAVQPEAIPDDMSAELSQLTGAAVERIEEQPTVEAPSAEMPIQAEQIPQTVQTEQPKPEQKAAEQAPEVIAQPVQHKSEPEKQEPKQTDNQPKAQVQAEQLNEAPIEMKRQAEDSGFQQTMQHSGDARAVQTQRTEQQTEQPKLFENAKLTVTEHEQQPIKAQQQTEAPIVRGKAVSERVVEKSDELMMLKSAVKRTPTEAGAELVRADIPVNVPRAELPEVKPTEVMQQVEVKLTELVQQAKQGATEYTLTLDPEDLGKITVKLTKASDGAVSVSIAAENTRTQRILEENGAMLQSTLKQQGIQLESWQTVSESQQDMHAEDYRGSHGNHYQGEQQQKSETEDGESFSEIIANM